MNLFSKISAGLVHSVDAIVDKNREIAQLNRLSAVIKSETETINRAYIVLGKQYHKILEGDTESVDMSHICAVIETSKIRLKKAQSKYNYISKYGMPKSSFNPPIAVSQFGEDIKTESEADEDEGDITIAYADGSSPKKPECVAVPENAILDTEPVNTQEDEPSEDSHIKAHESEPLEKETTPKYVAQSELESIKSSESPDGSDASSISEAVASLKKKRGYSRKKAADSADSEVENESEPLV